MSADFRLVQDGDHAVELHRAGGGPLLRYVFRPETPRDESPRPYAHPVRTLGGEVLTNFRPSDHRWHHGLSFTLNSVDGYNFWGGPTYRRGDGYRWRDDQGTQRHTAWLEQRPDRWTHCLDWRAGRAGECLLQEQRTLSFLLLSSQAWAIRWVAELRNVTDRTLALGHYFSREALAGSHYSGLQFRGARDLLDEHGDESVGIWAEGGLNGEAAVHGAAAHWMEWRGQKDGTQGRVRLRFANHTGPLHWFVRRHNPLAALPFHYERDFALAPGASVRLDHSITLSDENP